MCEGNEREVDEVCGERAGDERSKEMYEGKEVVVMGEGGRWVRGGRWVGERWVMGGRWVRGGRYVQCVYDVHMSRCVLHVHVC